MQWLGWWKCPTIYILIYTVFSVEHRLAPKYAILAHFCNILTFNHLPYKDPVRYPTHPIPHHEKPCFAPPSLPFRGSISYLSRLDTLPIAHRNMPNAPFRPSRCPLKTPKKSLSPLYFARKPDTSFSPKIATRPFGCADWTNDGFQLTTLRYPEAAR